MTQNLVDKAEEHEALRWLADQMRWERFLVDLHAGRVGAPSAAEAVTEPLAA
ncbi:MAG TPA: hypothetical protein VLL25_00785 [Acidimicrobiales bacterium]|nr:hypothetical protein [Acidimicrobiales bacterium]